MVGRYLEMIPQNFSWNDRKTVLKGNYAEDIINNYLEVKGYVIYNPTTSGPHAFDKLAIKNKENIIIAECKAKARRNKYLDTGINYRHYNEYKKIQEKYNIPVFIFFIDEMEKKIYGNFISKLESNTTSQNKQYPSIEITRRGDKIIYFPLKNTRFISDLQDADIEYLKKHSTRNYEYN